MASGPIAVPYDPDWPRRFAEEAERLEAALAPWLEGGIHHIGSTSVPGMYAKPIVDIMAGVRDLAAARAAFEPLAALDYAYLEHRPDALRFNKPASATEQREHTHHLHLTEPGSDLWCERLAFRDALREEPALAGEYARWKAEHYGRTLTSGEAPSGKWPFVRRVLAGRGIDLKPDEQRLASAELERRRSA